MVQYGENAASQKWCNMVREVFLVSLVHALRLSKKEKKKKNNNNKNKKENTKREKCQGRYLRVGASSLGSKVSYMHTG